jgi:tetratricopeptide (TPR) repeat protein
MSRRKKPREQKTWLAVIVLILLGVSLWVGWQFRQAKEDYLLAQQYTGQGKIVQAERLFRESIHRLSIPNSYAARSYTGLGYMYLHHGQSKKADAAFRQALDFPGLVYREKPRAMAGLGYVYLNQGRYVKARQAFRAAIDLNPEFGESYVGLGYLFYHIGRYRDAIHYFQEALDRNPDLAEAQTGMGYAYLRMGQYRPELYLLAAESFGKAVALDPYHMPAHAGKVYAEIKMADFDAAQKAGREAIRLNPNSAYVLTALGHNEIKLNHLDEAEKIFQEAISANRELDEAYVGLAYAFLKHNRHERARQQFFKALGLNSGQYRAYLGLAGMSDPEQSLAYLRTAFRINPPHGESRLDIDSGCNQPGQLLRDLEKAYYRHIKEGDPEALALFYELSAYPCSMVSVRPAKDNRQGVEVLREAR